jgi:predicted DNA-binding transcriptional regulator YafY
MKRTQASAPSAQWLSLLWTARAMAAALPSVDDLAVHFNVTPQTIRKDLNDLCDNGC